MITVTDLPLAGYIYVHEFKLTDVSRAENREFKFTFDISEEDFNRISVEYLNSCCCKFQRALKDLKTIIFKKA